MPDRPRASFGTVPCLAAPCHFFSPFFDRSAFGSWAFVYAAEGESFYQWCTAGCNAGRGRRQTSRLSFQQPVLRGQARPGGRNRALRDGSARVHCWRQDASCTEVRPQSSVLVIYVVGSFATPPCRGGPRLPTRRTCRDHVSLPGCVNRLLRAPVLLLLASLSAASVRVDAASSLVAMPPLPPVPPTPRAPPAPELIQTTACQPYSAIETDGPKPVCSIFGGQLQVNGTTLEPNTVAARSLQLTGRFVFTPAPPRRLSASASATSRKRAATER